MDCESNSIPSPNGSNHSNSTNSYRSGSGSSRAAMVSSPCAACKMLRRRCGGKCMLAPYFPSDDIPKFATAHRIFGASNIIKLLQDIPNENRADAVSSMVYEANARIRDPVYGCAGIVSQMQSHVSKLQTQLASAQAEILSLRIQLDNLVALCVGSPGFADQRVRADAPVSPSGSEEDSSENQMDSCSSEEDDPIRLWESFCKDW